MKYIILTIAAYFFIVAAMALCGRQMPRKTDDDK